MNTMRVAVLVSASFPLYRKSIRCFDHYRKFRRISLSLSLAFLSLSERPFWMRSFETQSSWHYRHCHKNVTEILYMKFIMMENFCHLSYNEYLECSSQVPYSLCDQVEISLIPWWLLKLNRYLSAENRIFWSTEKIQKKKILIASYCT